MAGNSSANHSMNVRLLINKKTRRVVYAEAGKDFVDLLLAFLLLPAGAIIRILQNRGTASSKLVGSMSNLYNSVDRLDADYMITDKSILLEPYIDSTPCNDLTLLQYSKTHRDYYACTSGHGSYSKRQISTRTGQKCSCGHEMKEQLQLVNDFSSYSSSTNTRSLPGYVKEAIQYIITDDLNIHPISTITSITELNRLQVKDISELQEMPVTVGSDKVLELLRASMNSNTALNDVFFPRAPSSHENIL